MLWLLTLAGCASCFKLPDEGEDSATPRDSNNFHTIQDTGLVDTSAGDSGGDDSGSLVVPRCEVELVESDEPNHDYLDMLDLPLNTFACGYMDRADDLDYLTFTTNEPGWVKVDVQAQSRGTSADLEDDLTLLDSDEGVSKQGRNENADPLAVFYAPVGGTYIAVLSEQAHGYGDAYGWWLKASMAKAPVDFGMTESEPNDTQAQGMRTEPGVGYFGTIGRPGDGDWYTIPVPEGTLSVDYWTFASAYGSATDTDLVFYWGGTGSDDLRKVYADSASADLTTDSAGGTFNVQDRREATEAKVASNPELGTLDEIDFTELRVRVYNASETFGSMFHWYVFDYSVTSETK